MDQQLIEQVKKDKAFMKLTASQKRVRIARDVIERLESGNLTATTGSWFSIEGERPTSISICDTSSSPSYLDPSNIVYPDTELREYINRGKHCSGCGLGNLFLCAVDRNNKLKLSEFNSDFNNIMGANESETEFIVVFEYLRKFFNKKQLMLIEYAYETGLGKFKLLHLKEAGISYRQAQKALKFVEAGDTNKEVMSLIMQNIVVNNGLFKPDTKVKRKFRELRVVGYRGYTTLKLKRKE